jgi:cytochrome d ubiquinol oxidase subunit II
VFGILFAASCLLTPFFFGTVAGALPSGRMPYGGYGDVVGSWTNPTSLFAGAAAVFICAYLAAMYLTGRPVGVGTRTSPTISAAEHSSPARQPVRWPWGARGRRR